MGIWYEDFNCDDDAIFREGLKQILIGINDIEIIDEASNGKKF